jgi:tripartite-type tricarboxylate transporter receptor subunit TctC
LIVPFPPGGSADITGRLLADHMGRGLGQTILVENKPGGSTIIGTEMAVRAPADGHTLLMVFPVFLINSAMRANVPYDAIRDFRAVGQALSVPMAIAVTPGLPIRNMAELIAYAKARPGEISYGTPGIGTNQHIVGEMLRLAAGIQITHAPFQGEIPALTAASGGHLPMVLVNAAAVAPYAKNGRVRAIVVTTRDRVELMPDVPTMREAGLPEIESSNWSGIVVAAATPTAVVTRLNTELVKALSTPEVKDKFQALSMAPTPGTAEQFDAMLQSDAARYVKAARAAGLKLE